MNQWSCYIITSDCSCSLHYLDMCFLAEVVATELLRRFTAAATPFLCWFGCTVCKTTIFGVEASRVRAHLRRCNCMRAKSGISRAASEVIHTRKQCFKLQDVGYVPNCQWWWVTIIFTFSFGKILSTFSDHFAALWTTACSFAASTWDEVF